MTLCQVHTALPIGNPAFGHFNFPQVENDIQSRKHEGKSYLNLIYNKSSFRRNLLYIDGLFLRSKRFAHFIDGWLQAFVIESEMRSFLIWSGNMFLFHVRSLLHSLTLQRMKMSILKSNFNRAIQKWCYKFELHCTWILYNCKECNLECLLWEHWKETHSFCLLQ